MSTQSAVVQLTNPDNEDRRAYKHVVDVENARRAAVTPTPETPLPASNNAERKASAELLYAQRVQEMHRSYIVQADDVTKRQILQAFDAQPDEAKRAAALAALQ